MASQLTNHTGFNILLTGGAGFLGTSMIRELLGKDALLPVKQLRVLDLQAVKGVSDPRFSFITGDVQDPDHPALRYLWRGRSLSHRLTH